MMFLLVEDNSRNRGVFSELAIKISERTNALFVHPSFIVYRFIIEQDRMLIHL
jgi:hypothetical protein